MSFSFNVERALHRRCIICDRRLGSHRIYLYQAQGTHWETGMKRSKRVDVEVCVCGESCLQRYEDGETGA